MPWKLEAYSWGGLTQAALASASWLLLAPFMFYNLAHFALPPASSYGLQLAPDGGGPAHPAAAGPAGDGRAADAGTAGGPAGDGRAADACTAGGPAGDGRATDAGPQRARRGRACRSPPGSAADP